MEFVYRLINSGEPTSPLDSHRYARAHDHRKAVVVGSTFLLAVKKVNCQRPSFAIDLLGPRIISKTSHRNSDAVPEEDGMAAHNLAVGHTDVHSGRFVVEDK